MVATDDRPFHTSEHTRTHARVRVNSCCLYCINQRTLNTHTCTLVIQEVLIVVVNFLTLITHLTKRYALVCVLVGACGCVCVVNNFACNNDAGR